MIPLPTLVERLEKLPAEIARIGFEIEELRRDYELKELECENFEAEKALKIKANQLGITATDLKYQVSSNSDVYKKKIEVVMAEANYKKKDIERTKLDNEFTGLKLIARIKMAEMSSIE